MSVEFGPWIDAANNGVKPDWIADDDECMCYWTENVQGGPYPGCAIYGFNEGFKVKLRKDHPRYAELGIYEPEPSRITGELTYIELPEQPTLRDQFAMAALAMMSDHYDDIAAARAYRVADAMLEARKKGN